MQKDQARLLAIWKRVKAEHAAQGRPPISQTDLALKWGVTPPLVGHYLHAREPVPVKWQLRFAEYLSVSVLEIWPDFEHAKLLQSGLPQDALKVALEYIELLPAGKEAAQTMMQALPRREPKKREAR